MKEEIVEEKVNEMTKRLMREEHVYRLRLTERELKLLLHILNERIETAEDIMDYGLAKRDDQYVEQKRVRLVAKGMVRRFTGTLQGKKRHFGHRAWWTCSYLFDYWGSRENKDK